MIRSSWILRARVFGRFDGVVVSHPDEHQQAVLDLADDFCRRP